MKNKSLFFYIFIFILTISILTIITFHILGRKTRIGYISNIELNILNTLTLNNLTNAEVLFKVNDKLDESAIKNYIFTNINITNYSYSFRIEYYSKIFRNSDLYGVYIDTNKTIQDNDFIKEIEMNYNGSPYGIFISDKIIDYDKIDNINYILKLKLIIYLFPIFIYLFILVLLFLYMSLLNL